MGGADRTEERQTQEEAPEGAQKTFSRSGDPEEPVFDETLPADRAGWETLTGADGDEDERRDR